MGEVSDVLPGNGCSTCGRNEDGKPIGDRDIPTFSVLCVAKDLTPLPTVQVSLRF